MREIKRRMKRLSKRIVRRLIDWEDAQWLFMLTHRVMREYEEGELKDFPSSSKEMYDEVLRRFRENIL